jgi:PhzF family phenazine biosynthesis protein
MSLHRFHQVDVFTATAGLGNPLAVVHDAQPLDDARMAAFARWTNLSETTFLLPPTDPLADYRVRIFTPGSELPFAGHPTLGSCHAWLAAGGQPRDPTRIVQQCGVGRVVIRRDGARLAFCAPPLRRSGPIDADTLALLRAALELRPDEILGHQWVDNGPGWCALLLASARRVLSIKPDWGRLAGFKLGLIGAQAPGADTDFEVRAFVPSLGVPEDPVTGSLNAGLAQWLIGAGMAPARYRVRQGTVLGRAGSVYLEQADDGIWVGGEVSDCIDGRVRLD